MSTRAREALEAAVRAAERELMTALDDELLGLYGRPDVVGVAATLELERRHLERELESRRRERLAAELEGRLQA